MMRLLVLLPLLCAGLLAVEPEELPDLAVPQSRDLLRTGAAAGAHGADPTRARGIVAGRTAPDPSGIAPQPEVVEQGVEVGADAATGGRGSTEEAEKAEKAEKDGEQASDRRPSHPGRDETERRLADPAWLARHWTQRAVLPPRLAANLLTRSNLVVRPLAADYRLKAGDWLRVVAWGGQPVNERIPVAANGDLAVPNFGLVPVAGLTAAEAQAKVLELVRSHFKQGGAIIAVEQPAAQAVTVVGEVVRPGYLTLPPGGTVIEALAAAGGVLPQGSLRTIRIAAAGGQQELDLYRIAVDGDAAALTPLPAGAVVFVPLAGPQVQVFGAVRRSAGVEVKPGETLAEALRLAGGLAPDADPAGVRLLREGPAGQELRSLAAGELAALPVADGDRVLVSLRRDLAGAAGSVSVRGAVRSPGIYPISAGLTLDQVLALAGGLLPRADAGRISVQRLLPQPQIVVQNGVPETVHHATLVALPGASQLAPLDEVEVPEKPKADQARSGVSIGGGVAKPGEYPFTPGMAVRDLLLLAEGALPTAQVDRADLVRSALDADGKRTASTSAVDLRPVLAGGEAGPLLQPGDSLIVRSTADARVRVTLIGQFRSTGTFTVPAGTTLGQIVQTAGGLLPEAFPRGARVFRTAEAEVARQFLDDLIRRSEISLAVGRRAALDAVEEEQKQDAERGLAVQEASLGQLRRAVATGRVAGIDLAGILAGHAAADQVLQDGDRIELPARPGTVRILGEVMVPGSLVFNEGLSAKELIRRSGGYTRQADQEAVFVVRADGSVVATAQGDTLAWDRDRRRWARSTLGGLSLLEGDAVIIPADVRYQDSNRRIVRDWTQIMFQVAATVGTIAVLAK